MADQLQSVKTLGQDDLEEEGEGEALGNTEAISYSGLATRATIQHWIGLTSSMMWKKYAAAWRSQPSRDWGVILLAMEGRRGSPRCKATNHVKCLVAQIRLHATKRRGREMEALACAEDIA